MVPALFEKVGSVVQSENAGPLLTLTTDSTAGSKRSDASTAFTLAPFGDTRTVVVNVCPDEYEPLFGVSERSAANVRLTDKKNHTNTVTKNFNEKLVFFIVWKMFDINEELKNVVLEVVVVLPSLLILLFLSHLI